MQNTSALYKSILANQNHWFETKVKLNSADYAESQLFSVSTRVGMFTGDPEVGKAVAGEIELSMINPNALVPTMAKIEPFVRVCGTQRTGTDVSIDENGIVDFGEHATLQNENVVFDDTATLRNGIVQFSAAYSDVSSEWLPKGKYYIDTREISHNSDGLDVLKIHGYDAMLFAEQLYPESSLAWPTSDIAVVNDIATHMGVEVDPRTTALMTENYQISLVAGYTMREVLGYIASMYVGSFVMSDEGKLRLVSIVDLPEETNYLIDTSGSAITFGGDRILV